MNAIFKTTLFNEFFKNINFYKIFNSPSKNCCIAGNSAFDSDNIAIWRF